MTGTIAGAVAKRDEQRTEVGTVAAFIQQMTPQIARALPRHMDADRLARIVLTEVRRTPLLAKCTQESFGGALMTISQLGLEPGPTGEAYLVPFRNNKLGKYEVRFILGYQGLAKLFWQHPLAKHLDAQAVHSADAFDYEYGLTPFLRHRPARGDRGEVTDYYAVATLSTGGSGFVVLTADEVKKLRGGKVGTSGDIDDPMRWMERKTAVRQLLKMLPKSPELAAAIALDEQVRTDTSSELIDLPTVADPEAIEGAVEDADPLAHIEVPLTEQSEPDGAS